MCKRNFWQAGVHNKGISFLQLQKQKLMPMIHAPKIQHIPTSVHFWAPKKVTAFYQHIFSKQLFFCDFSCPKTRIFNITNKVISLLSISDCEINARNKTELIFHKRKSTFLQIKQSKTIYSKEIRQAKKNPKNVFLPIFDFTNLFLSLYKRAKPPHYRLAK